MQYNGNWEWFYIYSRLQRINTQSVHFRMWMLYREYKKYAMTIHTSYHMINNKNSSRNDSMSTCYFYVLVTHDGLCNALWNPTIVTQAREKSYLSHWSLGDLDTFLKCNTGSGNGLVPSGKKPLLDPDLCRRMAYSGHTELTHLGRVTHICVGNLSIIGSDNGLCLVGAKPLPEPMLEYYQSDPRIKLQWNFIRNSYIFNQENAFTFIITVALSMKISFIVAANLWLNTRIFYTVLLMCLPAGGVRDSNFNVFVMALMKIIQ